MNSIVVNTDINLQILVTYFSVKGGEYQNKIQCIE